MVLGFVISAGNDESVHTVEGAMQPTRTGGTRNRRPRAEASIKEEEQTYDIARMYFSEDKTALQIAEEIGKSEAFVRRQLREARATGMVKILVTRPLSERQLFGLEKDMKSHFLLEDVCIVPGLEEVMDSSNAPDKEAVLIACCQRAAEYLEANLRNEDILAVPWGRVANYVARQLSPRTMLSDLTVVPMVGVMGIKPQTDEPAQEANTI